MSGVPKISAIMSSNSGWESLIETPIKNDPDFLSELLNELKSRLKDRIFRRHDFKKYTLRAFKKEEIIRKDILIDIVTDLYMKYLIKKNLHKFKEVEIFVKNQANIKEIKKFIDLIEGKKNSIYNKISEIFSAGFDANWKLTQCLLEYKVNVKSSHLKKIKRLMSCWDKYTILRYRIIHDYNFIQATKLNAKYNGNEKRRFRDFFEETRTLCLLKFNPESAHFAKKAYYYTLLQHHGLLIEKINNTIDQFVSIVSQKPHPLTIRSRSSPTFSRKMDKPLQRMQSTPTFPLPNKTALPTYSANDISQFLLGKQAKQIISVLELMKNWFLQEDVKKFFPNITKSLTGYPRQFPTIVVNLHETLSLHNAQSLKLHAENILKKILSEKEHFSHYHLNKIIPFVLEHIKDQHRELNDEEKEEPASHGTLFLFELCKLAQSLLKIPSSENQFRTLTLPIAKEIKKISKKSTRKEEIRKNIWSKLFSGRLNKKEINFILFDLDMEYLKHFLNLKPEHINKKLIKYTEKEPKKMENPTTMEDPMIILSDLFNRLSVFVKYHILTAIHIDSNPNLSTANAYKNSLLFIEEALKSPRINLHICKAIYTGLESVGVSRLSDTLFQELKNSHINGHEIVEKCKSIKVFINNIFNSQENFQNKPVLPYLGFISSKFYTALENSDASSRVQNVNQMLNYFYKIKALLEVTIPVGKFKTDAVSEILVFDETKLLKEPVGDFSHSEWNKLCLAEKLDYLSRWMWPTASI